MWMRGTRSMSRLLLLLLLHLLLFVGFTLAEHDNKFCQITSPGQGALPPMPKAYTMHLTSRREGIPARDGWIEHFDADRQKSSLVASMSGSVHRIVLDFALNQGLLINMSNTNDLLGACDVQFVNASDFMTSMDFKGSPVALPSRLFFGGGGVDVQAKGQSSIDGQTVDEYYSCHYWAARDTSLQVNWYFTATSNTVPVRVQVTLKDNMNGIQFTLTHDVTIFHASLPDWVARLNPFMAPPGLHCRGLHSGGRRPQTLPDRFSVRVESVPAGGIGGDLGAAPFAYFKESYDFRANLSLVLGHPPAASGDSGRYGEGRLLFVQDFQRGMTYISNVDMGNCTYRRLTDTDWDTQRDGNKLRMRSPREFFDLDTKNVQYKGTGTTRGIQTDVFITHKKIESGVPGIAFNATLEWYLANKTVTDSLTKEQVILSYPLSVLVSSEARWLSSWMYFYDFEQYDEYFNRHDIAACFGRDSKLHFWLYFPLSPRLLSLVRTQTVQFSFRLLPVLSLSLNISPLRILDTEVAIGVDGATVELTITEKPTVQTDIPETPLSSIKSLFQLRVSQSEVFSAVQDGSELVLATATTVDTMQERSPNGLKSVGYNAGDIAGAAIGLLMAGLLAGLIAAFLYFR